GAVVSYALCQFDIVCTPFLEHFIMESVSYMPLLAPIITIYHMTPYKEFLLCIARLDIHELKKSINETSATRAADRQISVMI
ncbi:hypothetical protein PMAYCL1PPCAC_14947, partial [Pristionchus mayeri]